MTVKTIYRLRPVPIRFVRLDSKHAQSDGKSVNRGLPLLDTAQEGGVNLLAQLWDCAADDLSHYDVTSEPVREISVAAKR